ncbi:Hypothetical Protein FCC1311_054902 [Hondaea fermentalgiana]|uniref:Uncharacterized protein n=1 Tax=Hondaea fermentalgiana TaxID=2315210 RepID=A0A2R5GHS0_9STRA|nr:Hypothetical Protein FCC1311_054902 [Hondaea fermentalgiana]|eukprot:GBG29268.1 Hypothetical Protein FCC1311_054902 [Hondaea fermentalgiana]
METLVHENTPHGAPLVRHLDTFAAGIIETSTQEDADNHVEADALGTWTDTHISISRALADIAKQSSIDSSTLMELKIDDDSTRQSKVWRLSLFPFLKYPATIFGLSTSVRIWFSANAEARPLASVSMLGEAKVQVQLKCLQDVDVFLEKARLNLGIIPVIRDGDVSTNDLHQPGTMMETSSLNLASGQPIVIGKSSFCRVSKLDANFGHLALLLRDSDGTVAGHAEVSLARLSRTPDRHEKLKLHTETTKQQKPYKESPERDDLERYETALEDNPGHVADSLFEQDRIEAIQRGLNGCLRLSRQQLWQLVADAGMWDTVAKGLGALRGDSETVLPLLDLGSLASLLHLESGSLAVRQLHRALLDLVRVESIETAFEQHERGDIEKAAAGFEMDSSLQQWRPLVAIPFDQWTADHIAMLFRVCGAGERRGKPATFVSRCRVTGKYLLEREMQGSFCLEQELCSLGVLDSIVRQRLQYQISLLAKRVAARTNQDLRNELSGTDQAVMGGTVAARNATTSLDDPEGAWWASRAFGLRARKPIKRWSVSDIGRLGKLLRFAPAILSRMEAYALDGRGFVDLTRDEMRYELGLSPHEVEVLDASRKLLLIPPQVLLGSSDYLQVRVLNQHESLWEAGGPEGKLCLALHRVHTLILRPGPGLMQAVDFASRKLERRHLLPAARIWFRLLEYTPGARDAAGDETKSFSDAGAASLTAVIRKHTIDTVGDRLRRWDPLHDLVQTRTGQLRGWRYLGTTSVERGCTDECARLDLAFNTAAFTSVLASKAKAGLDSQSNDNDATSDRIEASLLLHLFFFFLHLFFFHVFIVVRVFLSVLINIVVIVIVVISIFIIFVVIAKSWVGGF